MTITNRRTLVYLQISWLCMDYTLTLTLDYCLFQDIVAHAKTAKKHRICLSASFSFSAIKPGPKAIAHLAHSTASR